MDSRFLIRRDGVGDVVADLEKLEEVMLLKSSYKD
jgi:hypothetical protein